MTAEYRDAAMKQAQAELDAARAAFNAATPRTRAWREAEEELNACQSKVAFLAAPLSEYKPGTGRNTIWLRGVA